MKKKGRQEIYPEQKDVVTQIKEDAAVYGLKRDVLGVREVKDQLSSLLQRAAKGEEIVVTSDGVPTAMIVKYKPVLRGKPFKPHWDLLRSMPMSSDSTKMIRDMRDEGF